ncbi:MAG: hypothetical protein RSE91_03785 [Bacilli bacterium]
MSFQKRFHIRHFEYKKRYLIFALLLSVLSFISFYCIRVTYASYESRANLNLNVDNALYLFNETVSAFNINIDGIVPSSTPYISTFKVANYNNSRESDVDLSYTISIMTTTNIPLEYKLYRNEDYNNNASTSIIKTTSIVKDSDGAWYKILNINDVRVFPYKERKQDIYTLVINFPPRYASTLNYAGEIENIEVKIESKQILE